MLVRFVALIALRRIEEGKESLLVNKSSRCWWTYYSLTKLKTVVTSPLSQDFCGAEVFQNMSPRKPSSRSADVGWSWLGSVGVDRCLWCSVLLKPWSLQDCLILIDFCFSFSPSRVSKGLSERPLRIQHLLQKRGFR